MPDNNINTSLSHVFTCVFLDGVDCGSYISDKFIHTFYTELVYFVTPTHFVVVCCCIYTTTNIIMFVLYNNIIFFITFIFQFFL